MSSKVTLVICRHGNTFTPDVTPYMVGRKEDLMLTTEGEQQAEVIADVLRQVRWTPKRILAGPLVRTSRFAEIIRQKLACDLKVEIDDRLAEIDYGSWSGKTVEEIKSSCDLQAFSKWNESDVWPLDIGFQPQESQVIKELSSLLEQLKTNGENVLLISSNGRLKTLSRILGRTESGKIRTGCACVLQYEEGRWLIKGWNLSPKQLENTL